MIGDDPGRFRWVGVGIRKMGSRVGETEAVGCDTAWRCCGEWYDSGYEDRPGFGYLGDTVKKKVPKNAQSATFFGMSRIFSFWPFIKS